MDGFHAVTCLCQIFLRRSQVALLQSDVCSVHIRHGVGGIHAHCHVKHLVVGIRSNGVEVGDAEHLVQREQLRLGVKKLGCLGIGHGADAIFHRVVTVAQGGIVVVEDVAIVLGMVGTQFVVARVGFEGLVTHDAQQGIAVGKGGAGEEGVQTCPILGSVFHAEGGFGEVILTLHIFLQRGGTSLCQSGVVLPRAFGRGIAVDADGGDGDAVVVLDAVDGLKNLLEFGRVVAIDGVQDGAVDGIVQIGFAREGDDGVGGGNGREEGIDHLSLGVNHDGTLLAEVASEEVSAAAGVGDDAEIAFVHPFLVGDGV